jgi:hypothetical protein
MTLSKEKTRKKNKSYHRLCFLTLPTINEDWTGFLILIYVMQSKFHFCCIFIDLAFEIIYIFSERPINTSKLNKEAIKKHPEPTIVRIYKM